MDASGRAGPPGIRNGPCNGPKLPGILRRAERGARPTPRAPSAGAGMMVPTWTTTRPIWVPSRAAPQADAWSGACRLEQASEGPGPRKLRMRFSTGWLPAAYTPRGPTRPKPPLRHCAASTWSSRRARRRARPSPCGCRACPRSSPMSAPAFSTSLRPRPSPTTSSLRSPNSTSLECERPPTMAIHLSMSAPGCAHMPTSSSPTPTSCTDRCFRARRPGHACSGTCVSSWSTRPTTTGGCSARTWRT